MTREELLRALRGMKVETGSLACLGCGHEHNCSLHGCAVIREAAEALTPLPNPPLTLEQLREMDGEPVWVQYGQYDGEWVIVAWNIYDAISYVRKTPCLLSVYSYGKTWLAYRHKPEEGMTHE